MKNKFIKELLLLLFCITLVGCVENKKIENNHEKSTNAKSEEKNNKKIEYSKSEKMLLKILDLVEEGLAYDTGSYIAGEVKPGEYAFVKFNGSGSYFCEKDASGSIVDNENFNSFGYVKVHGVGNLETKGALINVSAFDKLGVSSAKEIYENLNDLSNYNQGGYYKVGVDLEAGSYIVESIGGNGYYAIMTGPVSNSEIVDNDNFSGKVSINLSNGQYVNISRSTITKQ